MFIAGHCIAEVLFRKSGVVGTLTIHLHLPACNSLKEKRSRLKPLIGRLRREFNISVAEMALQDRWQESVITCGMVGNEAAHLHSALQTIRKWISGNWPDGMIIAERIEVI